MLFRSAITKSTVAFVLCALALGVYASSHSEAPGTAGGFPGADVTDVYAFRCYEPGREDYTCVIVNVYPLQAPYGGPNYFSLSDGHFYELYIDNDGDAKEDLTFQFFYGNRMGGDMEDVPFVSDEDDCVQNSGTRSVAPEPLFVQKHAGLTVQVDGRDVAVPLKFIAPVTAGNDAGLNWFQWFRVNLIEGDRTYGDRTELTAPNSSDVEFEMPMDYAGTKSFPAYDAYANQFIHTVNLPNCANHARMFVGQRAESFPISVGAVFDLVNMVPVSGLVAEDPAQDDLAFSNVASFAMELPTECLTSGNNDVLGFWAATRELHHDGDDHIPGKQVSRLGNPLVNELLVGLKDKNRFSNSEPRFDDEFNLKDYIRYPALPELLNILFLDGVNAILGSDFDTIAPTNFPRDDLYAIFFTGIGTINSPANVVDAEMLRLKDRKSVV